MGSVVQRCGRRIPRSGTRSADSACRRTGRRTPPRCHAADARLTTRGPRLTRRRPAGRGARSGPQSLDPHRSAGALRGGPQATAAVPLVPPTPAQAAVDEPIGGKDPGAEAPDPAAILAEATRTPARPAAAGPMGVRAGRAARRPRLRLDCRPEVPGPDATADRRRMHGCGQTPAEFTDARVQRSPTERLPAGAHERPAPSAALLALVRGSHQHRGEGEPRVLATLTAAGARRATGAGGPIQRSRLRRRAVGGWRDGDGARRDLPGPLRGRRRALGAGIPVVSGPGGRRWPRWRAARGAGTGPGRSRDGRR